MKEVGAIVNHGEKELIKKLCSNSSCLELGRQ